MTAQIIQHVRTITVEPDAYGLTTWCHLCSETIHGLEAHGTYDHGDAHTHDVCPDCLTAGVEHIRGMLNAEAEHLSRRAAALRTDPLFSSEADRLDAQAAEFRADARARWVLPTDADWAAFHRETGGACLPSAQTPA